MFQHLYPPRCAARPNSPAALDPVSGLLPSLQPRPLVSDEEAGSVRALVVCCRHVQPDRRERFDHDVVDGVVQRSVGGHVDGDGAASRSRDRRDRNVLRRVEQLE